MTINIFGFDLGSLRPPFTRQNSEMRRLRKYERRAAAIHAEITGAKLSRGERLTDMQLLETFRNCRAGQQVHRLDLTAPYGYVQVQYWVYREGVPESVLEQCLSGNKRNQKTDEDGPEGGHFSRLRPIVFRLSG